VVINNVTNINKTTTSDLKPLTYCPGNGQNVAVLNQLMGSQSSPLMIESSEQHTKKSFLNSCCSTYYLHFAYMYKITPGISSLIISSSDNKSVSHWIMFDYFFLFNYVPHLFLLTCVKFHGKKIDNNYILTHICLPSLFQMASYDIT
jgi:hypothetical protein